MKVHNTKKNSVVPVLVREHDQMKALILRLEKSRPTSVQFRMRGLETFSQLLVTHAEVEERLIYSTLDHYDPKLAASLQEGVEEHHLTDQILEEMRALSPLDPRWAAKAEVLRESLEHHLDEEEEDLFSVLKKIETEHPQLNLRTKWLTGVKLARVKKAFQHRFASPGAIRNRATPLFGERVPPARKSPSRGGLKGSQAQDSRAST